MTDVRLSTLALALIVTIVSSGVRVGAQQPTNDVAGDISPEALAEIEALIAEKDARSAAEQKVDSQLLYASRMALGEPIAEGVWAVDTDVPYATDGHVVVDVQARPASDVAARVSAAGVEVTSASADGSALRVHIDLDQVETLAADPDVLFVQPMRRAAALAQDVVATAVGATGRGTATSEGDVTHLAFAARGAFHVDGAGVKIGVLSDGVSSLAVSQARGDLDLVNVLPGQAGSGDEGTALLEIIHDLAPGAELYFATGFTSITSFAQNIRDLRAAGCDIIIDDVLYPAETPFQDGAPGPTPTNGGAVIQAVKDVTASGALYFSAAGNGGNLDSGTSGVWEGDFVDGGATSVVSTAGRVHKFGVLNFDQLVAISTKVTTLFWSDPLGASSNDYDLFRLNQAGTAVVAASTNLQTGTQDPFESIAPTSNPLAGIERLVVVKKLSAQPRFLHLDTNGGRLSSATAGATRGHNSARAVGAYGVAATPAVGPYPQPFNSGNVVETSSSDGPRRVFYQGDGTPITPGDVSSTGGLVLQKPDVTAADGVSVTGVGGVSTPLFGTSAAAAHAAAIAALVKSANPGLTAAQIRTALTSTAIDIQAPGVDRDSGAGIVMARDALSATPGAVGTAFLQVERIDASDNPGNGNGAIETGEGARVAVTLKNYGVAPATHISTLLRSSTPGVAIAQPAARAYADLNPSTSATGDPVLFTIAGNYPCGLPASFTLNVSYSGGLGPQALGFAVPVASPPFTVTTTLDANVPIVPDGVVAATGAQNARLFRDGVPSVCGFPKAFPGITGTGPRQFDAYGFNTCSFSGPSCVTVTLSGAAAGNLFVTGYAPTFDPANIATNYRGDAGASGATRSFSFDVKGRGDPFAVDVAELNAGGGTGTRYTLTVSGACYASCDHPPNQPPVARAKNVIAPADDRCLATASVDDGSFDPDTDPLTLVQSPAAPYPLGSTGVLLTATDPSGAFSQATATVSVVDQTAPVVTSPIASPAVLSRTGWLVSVTVSYDAKDNCSAASCVLTAVSSQPSDDDDEDEPDIVVVDAHHVMLRADAKHGTDRIYTLTVTCTDAAGNATVQTTTVVVPHDRDRTSGDDRDGRKDDSC